MVTHFKQFYLLVWRNVRLRMRHPILTVFEIMIPTLLSLILLWVSATVFSSNNRSPTITSVRAEQPLFVLQRVTDAHHPSNDYIFQGIIQQMAAKSSNFTVFAHRRNFLSLQHTAPMETMLPSLYGKKHFHFQRLSQSTSFKSSLLNILPFVFILSFIYPLGNVVKILVLEKERKLRIVMKVMGLSPWMSGVTWFMEYMIFLAIASLIMTMALTMKVNLNAIFSKSNPYIIYLMLFIYAASTISWGFFLSAFFVKANSASLFACLISLLTALPYYFVPLNEMNLSEKLTLALLINTAISDCIEKILMWEDIGVGLQWSTITKQTSSDDNLTVSHIFIMMGVDTIIYLILAWYIEAVFPKSEYMGEVWYFPFTKSYWCRGRTAHDIPQFHAWNDLETSSEFFEEEPNGFEIGIHIHNLTKVFGKKKTPAVNKLCMNMYKGQVMVLLGHNGAGKTTLISMLIGLLPPTSGNAWVNGVDISRNKNEICSNIGICLQYDTLFDDLTVQEHLYFFAMLKNCPQAKIASEVNDMIATVGLKDKRSVYARNLSGGMKRKLCTAMAFIGNSPVVILDEPSTGLDPLSRRTIWGLVQKMKKNCTVLLTTHFMDEADVLGDRIAIMDSSELQCCGSPLFLKKKYGAGYNFILVKEDGCDVSRISSLVKSHIPNAKPAIDIGADFVYILPYDSVHLFEALFSEIEQAQQELKISSFGASMTTMKDVFVKVTERTSNKETAEEILNMPDDSEDTATGNCSVPGADKAKHRNSGVVLFLQKLRALLHKRMLYSMRKGVLTLLQLIFPLMFLAVTIRFRLRHKLSDSLYNEKTALRMFRVAAEDPYTTIFQNGTRSMNFVEIFAPQFNSADSLKSVNTGHFALHLVHPKMKRIKNFAAMVPITLSMKNETERNKMFLNYPFNNKLDAFFISSMLLNDTLLDVFYISKFSDLEAESDPSEIIKHQTLLASKSLKLGVAIMICLAIPVSSFAEFIVKERSIGAKHLQQVSGLQLPYFWLAEYLWDMAFYLVSCFTLMMVLGAFQLEGFTTAAETGRLFLLFFVLGFSFLPTVYCLSFLFQLPATVYGCLIIFFILTGYVIFLCVNFEWVGKQGTVILDWVSTICLPNYCVGRAVSKLHDNYINLGFCNHDSLIDEICNSSVRIPRTKMCCPEQCGDSCIKWQRNYLSFSSPGIGMQLVFLSIQAIVFPLLLIAIEEKLFSCFRWQCQCLINHFKHSKAFENVIEDRDVVAECLKILDTPLQELQLNNTLIIKKVSKCYGDLIAVNDLTLGIRKGECFGLLGLNGAGKTTTFKMMTGDISITSGEIFLNGLSVKTSLRAVQQNLGYCPQFDALLPELTGRETLTFYARLRGLPEKCIPNHVMQLSSSLSFAIHIDKKVKAYSGGNKRKLSVAVALLGDPPMIVLDEPTSGMDPISRNKIKEVLHGTLRMGQSIVLTSHSMDECEALCTRLAIMVNGKLCCLGSTQYLISKFGNSVTLVIKVGRRPSTSKQQASVPKIIVQHPDNMSPQRDSQQVNNMDLEFERNVNEIKTFVGTKFVNAVLEDEHDCYLHYVIQEPQLSWSQIFGTIEHARSSLNIEDYSVGQTTLDQVFFNFTREQVET